MTFMENSMAVWFFCALLIFAVCREVFCWYSKQTEQVKLLKEIRDLLKGASKTSPL